MHTNRRVAALHVDGGRVRGLQTTDGPTDIAPGEAVILAVPPWVATTLLPGLIAPDAFESIVNLHFRAEADASPAGFVALVGGIAEWVFVKPGIVSTTTSAANRYADLSADHLATVCWNEARAALNLPGPRPPWRLVREKRATFAATAEQECRRPGPLTNVSNLTVAGDWTATGLPATIEGAIRSGTTAAAALLERIR